MLADIAGWDAEYFGMSPREALRMDPAQRLLMELMHETFEDGGLLAADVAGTRTGVLVGLMDTQQYGRLQIERLGSAVAGDPYFGQGVSPSVLAGRLAYHYDLHGPTVTIDTACSSSLVGVHLAIQALRRGECESAVAGGVFLVVTPDTYVQACATSQLTSDGRCKTFDKAADGYVIGEGAGLVMLETLSSAQRNGRRIHAVLHGSAMNQDGRSNGLTAPNRGAQAAVIRQALADARVAPDDIGYVEAHGSATALGDAIELGALHDVFAAGHTDRPLRVGAVKTNIGHTQSAAGVAGLIKTVLALKHGQLPSSLNLTDPTDSMPTDGTLAPVLRNTPFPAGPARLAGVSGFGWSGTNAHIVVGPAPTVAQAARPTAPQSLALTVSAASDTALRAQLHLLAEWIPTRPDLDLGDLAHTLARGRTHHDFRCGVIGTHPADAARQLAAAALRTERRPGGPARVAFLLPGVGDEYAGLGAELYQAEPVFAAAVDECLSVLEERNDVDLRPHLFRGATPQSQDAVLGGSDGEAADPLRKAELAHSYLFTVEYALTTLLMSRGVRPEIMIGYSLGEYVAACIAGVFTLPDALHVIVERARLISGTSAGSMLAAVADETTVRAAIARSGADVDIAALNGPSMTVVSGVAGGIDTLAAQLRSDGVAAMRLRTANAFHSSLLAPVRDKLAAVLDTVERHAPQIPLISNRTGEPLTAEEATTSEYWADHLISPVRFEQSVRHCLAAGITTFVEVGAGQTLGGLLHRDLAPGEDIAVVGTLPNALSAATHRESARLVAACARLWELGVPIQWDTMIPTGNVVSAPTYAFQRTRYWPEAPAAAALTTSVMSSEPSDLGYTESWSRDVTRRDPSSITGHVIVFADDGVGEGFLAYAHLEQAEVTLVRFGREFRDTCERNIEHGRRVAGTVTIDRSSPEDYRRLFARVPDDAAVQIVYLRSLHAAGAHDAMTEGYDPLLLAVQACGDRPAGVRLLTVSRGGSEVLGGDAIAPQSTAPHGLGRVARHEYRELTWQGVDLDPDEFDPIAVARQLADELTHPADGTLSAWRRGRRWTPDWAALTIDADDDLPVWRPEGAYLITGGARGLGRALARHLVGQGVRRLALVSRTATAQDVTEFTGNGVDVLLLDADTAQADQLIAAFANCRAHFGSLDGIVHAAGVPASGMLRRQTVAGAHDVIAPKVAALQAIQSELHQPEPPHLVVLYSSAITTFGAIGEGDYCAANTVLDAYGRSLDAAAADTQVVSVAWGPWLHDVWQTGADGGPVSELAARAGAYRQRFGFADDAGHVFLDQVVRSARGAVVAVRQPMLDAEREWLAMLDIDALVGASAAAPTGQRFPRPDLRVEYVAPRGQLEQVVAAVWEQFLGIEAVGVHDPFFDLGGNSLVGLAMLHALEHELATTIAPAVLFEHPTVAEIAAALERSTSTTASGGPAAADLIDASADRGQRRRRARTAGRKGPS